MLSYRGLPERSANILRCVSTIFCCVSVVLHCVSIILCSVSIIVCCVSQILCCVSRIVCCVCRYGPPYIVFDDKTGQSEFLLLNDDNKMTGVWRF